jgi:PAS domain-containing protein
MASRFYPQKDIDTFDKFNRELVGDLNSNKDGIIYQPVVIYKVSVYDTEVNMYGESSDGKVYKDGVQVSALVTADDQTTTTDEFGPDLQQTALFSFIRKSLVDISYVVDIGDVIDWNSGYWEISSISENQLVGGQTDYNHSVVCNTFLVRISNLNIERVRSI